MTGDAVRVFGVGNAEFGEPAAPATTLSADISNGDAGTKTLDSTARWETGVAVITGDIASSDVGDKDAELGWLPNSTCARFSNAGIINVTTSFWNTLATYITTRYHHIRSTITG
jgi:hypothetical protein